MPALSVVEVVAGLEVEHDENEQRKEPTVSEKVALAQAIAERLRERHGGDRKSDQAGKISHLIEDAGRTKNIAAAKAGLGSGKTLEAMFQCLHNPTARLCASITSPAPDASNVNTVHKFELF